MMTPARWWPVALIGVLAVTVVANGFMLWAATGPAAAVIEPNYYRKAMAWDATLADARRSAALGWRVEAELEHADARGADVCMTLVDRDGRPVAGAVVDVTAIHNLEAGRPTVASARTDTHGRAIARLPLTRPGLWELRLVARRGSDRFQATLRRERPRPATPFVGASDGPAS